MQVWASWENGRRGRQEALLTGCRQAPPLAGIKNAPTRRDHRQEDSVAHTHEYDCIVCGAHFDSSKDLDKHNQEEHIRNATGMERPRDPDAEEPGDQTSRGEPTEG